MIQSVIYEASDQTEYSLQIFAGEVDRSFLGICNKILGANPKTTLVLGDLYFSTRDQELGLVGPGQFLK